MSSIKIEIVFYALKHNLQGVRWHPLCPISHLCFFVHLFVKSLALLGFLVVLSAAKKAGVGFNTSLTGIQPIRAFIVESTLIKCDVFCRIANLCMQVSGHQEVVHDQSSQYPEVFNVH